MTIMSLSSTVVNLDDHLRFSSHQEKYPASTSSSSRQVGKSKSFRQHDIEKDKFRFFKGNVNIMVKSILMICRSDIAKVAPPFWVVGPLIGR